jgi:nicotinamide riboside kinase
VLTGPESCGKTTLAHTLCESLHAPLVPEVAREYLNQKINLNNQFEYSEPDLLEIATAQDKTEAMVLEKQPALVLCDTDLLVLIIWSEVRFGHCHPWILDTFASRTEQHNRYYLLCDFNVPWQPDPLRESSDSREELYNLYLQKLEHYNLDYTIMAGSVQERMDLATKMLNQKMIAH